MSLTSYTFDPCLRSGLPCGASKPFSNNPRIYSWNDLRPCSSCPGGGCSSCPAPVRPSPTPCPPQPALPWLPPCPPCERELEPPPPPREPCATVAIPCCRPRRYRPCPVYRCPRETCLPKRCSYPGVPICCGPYGPVMPVW